MFLKVKYRQKYVITFYNDKQFLCNILWSYKPNVQSDVLKSRTCMNAKIYARNNVYNLQSNALKRETQMLNVN